MSLLTHHSAQASHYNEAAKHYDEFNEANAALINQTIEHILQQQGVKTVLDLTCGTGSQVFWLTKRGYDVTGYDINANMLKVARSKAKKENLPIKFRQGDMRTTQAGKFDVVLTIFNAVGHLTKLDFEQAIRNINSNLRDGGLYVFDIFNLDYLIAANNITSLTIDWQETANDTQMRKIQYSTILNHV